MPSINSSLGPNGPLLTVAVGLSKPHADLLTKLGKTVPTWVRGTFLVDTGASGTCMDPRFVQPLGLTPTGSVSVQTPSTNGVPVTCSQYDICLYIPGSSASAGGFYIEALPALESSFTSQGIDGLIGRDVLDRCTLIYNGSAGMFSLAY